MGEEELRDRVSEELDLLHDFDENDQCPDGIEEPEDDGTLAADRSIV